MLFDGSASPGKPSAPSGANRVFRKNLGQCLSELLIKKGNVSGAGHVFATGLESSFVPGCTRCCIESLPVPSVKRFRLQRREVDIINAARVDVDLVRIRTWHIERMDAAVLAERMLGHASVECVGR